MAKPRKNSAGEADGDSSAGEAGRLKPKPKPKRTRKSVPRECPPQRSSSYRGVTRHRWTGRFEAHLWDKDAWNDSRSKKGRQVYLGAYDDEEEAARAHDLAALKYWGSDTVLNFPLCNYNEELKEMEEQSREEYIGSLRRKSSGFSRGVSKYRGVARHHHNGKWEARIGRVFGNKYLYLGTYATQEEAAVAYDIAAIEHRGLNAVTNFDISRYVSWLQACRPAAAVDDDDADFDLDEALAATFHDDDELRDVAAAGGGGQLAAQAQAQAQLPRPDHSSAPTISALALLLQSRKFKEMIEQAAASESSAACTALPSSSSSSTSAVAASPSPPPPPAQEEQQQSEYNAVASPVRCSFPDDVQTYFGCDDDGVIDYDYAEIDTFLFGDLGAYAAPMFQCELNV